MTVALRYIFSIIIAFFWTVSSFAQEKDVPLVNNDSYLNQYELLCSECMELKHLVSSGGTVSRAKASEAISRFLEVNGILKAFTGSMTESQRIRFERINSWFITGNKPLALDDSLELPALDFNAGKIPYENFRAWLSSHQDDSSDRAIARQEIRRKRDISYLVLLSGAFPWSCGLKLGVLCGRWGGYLSGRGNFISPQYDYSCSSDAVMDNGNPFWGTGRSKRGCYHANAGVIFGAHRHWNVYLGAGYGKDVLAWEDIQGIWARVRDYSADGFSTEAGVISSWRKFAFSIGVSNISFRRWGLEIGVGIRL